MRVNRQFSAYVLVLTWLFACAAAFWWFEFRYIDQFDNNLTSFNGQPLKALKLEPSANQLALVVHFVDPDCPCSRFSAPHIADLERTFNGLVEFRQWSKTDERPYSLSIPASPAVAIWTNTGALAYFGPYSSGAICGKGDDLVTSTLNKLHQGYNPEWINNDTVGCFCPWHNPEEIKS
ncbi:MAG: DUF6436 domain-containing protein [Spongiibacteraceae bacterium]